ncbi:hypothetical protein ACFQWF_14700 [Methylorubrum suomiense]
MPAAPAAAGDFGPADQVHVAYNRTAERIDSASRMTPGKCEDRAARYCDYTVTGSLAVVATSPPRALGKAQIITLIYAKGSDIDAFIGAIGLAMATWSPFTTAEQRGAALKALTGTPQRRAVLAGVEYRLSTSPETGVVLTLVPTEG